MAATRRIPLSLLLFTTLTTAMELIVSGQPQPGEVITLTWDGEGPWTLLILTATSAEDSFIIDRRFSDITVTNAVWNVDVALGTLVEFEITDSTGDSASQFIQIDDGGAALSSSSVASQSSESVASTQSLSSVFSESSVASVSSISMISTESVASATSTTELPASTPVESNANASPSQTVSDIPPATLSASSSSASQTSGVVVPPNQLSTSSGPKPGAIAGGVIAAILGLLLLLVLGRICYRRRLRAREQDQEAKIYPFMVDEALTNTASSNHRRTLSRSKPEVVNWNPEEPHLTPAGPAPGGQEHFGNRNYRLSSSLGKFGELGLTENSNALGMDLNPAPAPTPALTPPQPVMTTVPNATRPSVLDLARGIAGSKRASDLPLYNRASIYNPTSLQQPNFGRPSLDSQSGSGTGTGPKVSPFADKFAVEGKYEPDLEDPAVMASVASAQAPRPPRPARPEGLELDEASATDASASTSTPPPRPQRNSISNPGPVPTVGHTRKISGPIPFKPQSPPARARQQQRSVDLFPSWALVNSDGRYPAITVQTPTTASVISVSSPTGSMAGVGAGRVASSQPGRQIYPAAALPPQRQPSLKSKRVSVAQSERGMSAAAIQAARAQSPPTVRSPPPGAMRAQSPPAVAMRAQSPPAVAARAQSPPAILTRAQFPPVLAAFAQSPPPTVSHKPSSSVEAPPRPPRAVGPRAKPVTPPSATETPDAPIVTLPLTPPRRIWAEPDVPTTPTTPALSNFPTPPRTVKNVVASSSSSMAGSTGHHLQGSGSSVASRSSTIITAGETAFSPVLTTAATTAFPDIELNGPTPVASPQVKGRALQPPPPISTGLHASPSSYGVSSAPNGLSPITASPQSLHHSQIPTPLASSTLGSPTTLAQFGQAMLPGGGGITRDSSVKTTYTMSTASENTHNVFRRELMQGLPSAVGMAHNVAGPSSPTYFPESVSNYHPPVPQLPLPGTFAPHVPRPAVDSWGIAPSIYDASSMNGAGKHVSIAPSYLSANSGRRLSEGTTSGDAEWKELERQLAATGGDVAHIMPRNNGSM